MLNARSVCNKLNELYCLLYGSDYDIMMITETWLNNRMPDAMLDPSGRYSVMRHDRPRDTTGGGVCAFVRKPIRTVAIECMASYSHLELGGFDIHYNLKSFRQIVVYRPGYLRVVSLVDCLQNLVNVNMACIIAGDLNCSAVDWVKLLVPSDGMQDAITNSVVKKMGSYKLLLNQPEATTYWI